MRVYTASLWALGMLVVTLTSHAEVYQWVDTDGVAHFSDEPIAGAKPVDQQPITTFPDNTVTKNILPAVNGPHPSRYYQSLVITAPKPQHTIWDANGRVSVVIRCQPKLKEQDAFELVLDGQPLGRAGKNRLVVLNGVERGAHTIRVIIVNEQHKTIQSSKSVVFYLQKPRIAKPGLSGAVLKHPK